MKAIGSIALLVGTCAFGQGSVPAPLAIKYATYFGGSGVEIPTAIVHDVNGNIILVGSTTSTDLPGTANSFQPSHAVGYPGNTDVFIAKLDPTGTNLIWASYLGGYANDTPTGLGVDGLGNVYIVGFTESPDFPLTITSPPPQNGALFLCEVSADGTRLVYSRFVLTEGLLYPLSLAVLASGESWIAGANSPGVVVGTPQLATTTPGALSWPPGSGNALNTAFIEKFDSTGSPLILASFADTSSEGTYIYGIVATSDGNAYVAGFTTDAVLTTSTSIQPTFSNQGLEQSPANAFAVEINGAGSTLEYGTYFGPKYFYTAASGILVDSSGSTYLLGGTNATNLPASAGSFTKSFPNDNSYGIDGYLAKLSPGASAIQALTYVPIPNLAGVPAYVRGMLTNDGRLAVLTGSELFELDTSTLGLNSSFALAGIVNTNDNSPALSISPSSTAWIFGAAGNIDPYITSVSLQKTNLGSNAVLVEVAPFQPTISVVKNAASFSQGTLSPGELITIFGSELGPRPGIGLMLNGQTVTSTLGGTTVSFDGMLAPLLYSGANQVNAVIPFSIGTGFSPQVTVQYMGVTSNSISLPLQPSAPGIFTATGTGHGQGAIVNQDGSPNSSANPAPRGSAISIYATGAGQTLPSAIDGMLASGASELVLPVTVGIANGGVPVLYAGDAPGLVEGVIQINARIPDDAPVGPAVPLVVRIGDAYSQTVTVAIR